jgi:hypothetical protein
LTPDALIIIKGIIDYLLKSEIAGQFLGFDADGRFRRNIFKKNIQPYIDF